MARRALRARCATARRHPAPARLRPLQQCMRCAGRADRVRVRRQPRVVLRGGIGGPARAGAAGLAAGACGRSTARTTPCLGAGRRLSGLPVPELLSPCLPCRGRSGPRRMAAAGRQDAHEQSGAPAWLLASAVARAPAPRSPTSRTFPPAAAAEAHAGAGASRSCRRRCCRACWRAWVPRTSRARGAPAAACARWRRRRRRGSCSRCTRTRRARDERSMLRGHLPRVCG